MAPHLAGHLAMLLFSALIAGSFALGVQIANEIDPIALNAVRFWIAAAIVGAIAWRKVGFRKEYAQAPWRYFILSGSLVVYFVLMFEGLKTAPAVSAAAVATLIPVFAAGFGYLLLRQMLTRRMALALFIGAIGAIWVIFRADVAALLAFDIGRGEAIYFVGCVSHALYTPMVRKLNRGEPVLVFTFGTLVVGAPAKRQGDGLYLSDAQLGDGLECRARGHGATRDDLAGDWFDHCRARSAVAR